MVLRATEALQEELDFWGANFRPTETNVGVTAIRASRMERGAGRGIAPRSERVPVESGLGAEAAGYPHGTVLW
jgi:hypothetical protein